MDNFADVHIDTINPSIDNVLQLFASLSLLGNILVFLDTIQASLAQMIFYAFSFLCISSNFLSSFIFEYLKTRTNPSLLPPKHYGESLLLIHNIVIIDSRLQHLIVKTQVMLIFYPL